MAEATIGELVNLARATASDQGVVEALIQKIIVSQNSWRITPPSLLNSGLCSIRNDVESVEKELSTHHKAITVLRMASKLAALTRASPANSRNTATNRRPLERTTWEVVKQTENYVQGRHL
jgi:hypothetical protein